MTQNVGTFVKFDGGVSSVSKTHVYIGHVYRVFSLLNRAKGLTLGKSTGRVFHGKGTHIANKTEENVGIHGAILWILTQ